MSDAYIERYEVPVERTAQSGLRFDRACWPCTRKHQAGRGPAGRPMGRVRHQTECGLHVRPTTTRSLQRRSNGDSRGVDRVEWPTAAASPRSAQTMRELLGRRVGLRWPAGAVTAFLDFDAPTVPGPLGELADSVGDRSSSMTLIVVPALLTKAYHGRGRPARCVVRRGRGDPVVGGAGAGGTRRAAHPLLVAALLRRLSNWTSAIDAVTPLIAAAAVTPVLHGGDALRRRPRMASSGVYASRCSPLRRRGRSAYVPAVSAPLAMLLRVTRWRRMKMAFTRCNAVSNPHDDAADPAQRGIARLRESRRRVPQRHAWCAGHPSLAGRRVLGGSGLSAGGWLR